MKLLLIGGRSQGKTAYAAANWAIDALPDGESCPLEADLSGGVLRLHLLVARRMASSTDPGEEILRTLDRGEDWLVVCDEIGGGIVPIDREEREWRELTGRLCCEIAARADRVERICCGLPQRLKG